MLRHRTSHASLSDRTSSAERNGRASAASPAGSGHKPSDAGPEPPEWVGWFCEAGSADTELPGTGRQAQMNGETFERNNHIFR